MQYFAVRKVLWRNFRSLLQRGVVASKEKLRTLNNMFCRNVTSKLKSWLNSENINHRESVISCRKSLSLYLKQLLHYTNPRGGIKFQILF